MGSDNVVRLHPDVEIKSTSLDQETVDDLRRRAILRDQEHNIELDPVGPGETMIGTLTDLERTVYVEVAAIHEELQELSRELTARSLEIVAAAVRKSDRPDQLPHNIDDSRLFPSRQDAEDYFERMTRLEHLRAVFNSSIRQRYGHGAVYGVRNGFTVVRVAYKYETPKIEA